MSYIAIDTPQMEMSFLLFSMPVNIADLENGVGRPPLNLTKWASGGEVGFHTQRQLEATQAAFVQAYQEMELIMERAGYLVRITTFEHVFFLSNAEDLDDEQKLGVTLMSRIGEYFNGLPRVARS